ncbi:hypothetical protein [Rhodoblastus sp.]|uniref:hypothetical protein n=1 Tax=Rhodoblastus sp. TaxID=1962975 RepID=UPI0026210F2B|nr:hypothetical protein [Rhodoblastus sp.]
MKIAARGLDDAGRIFRPEPSDSAVWRGDEAGAAALHAIVIPEKIVASTKPLRHARPRMALFLSAGARFSERIKLARRRPLLLKDNCAGFGQQLKHHRLANPGGQLRSLREFGVVLLLVGGRRS